jgi:hypothetical protein
VSLLLLCHSCGRRKKVVFVGHLCRVVVFWLQAPPPFYVMWIPSAVITGHCFDGRNDFMWHRQSGPVLSFESSPSCEAHEVVSPLRIAGWPQGNGAGCPAHHCDVVLFVCLYVRAESKAAMFGVIQIAASRDGARAHGVGDTVCRRKGIQPEHHRLHSTIMRVGRRLNGSMTMADRTRSLTVRLYRSMSGTCSLHDVVLRITPSAVRLGLVCSNSWSPRHSMMWKP